jgi:Domain of unknown function (DUF4112)
MTDFLIGVAVGVVALGAIGLALYFVLRRTFERASHRVADDIGNVLADLSGRAAGTPMGQRAEAAARAAAGGVTHLGAYAAAKGMSEEAARREFTETIERLARLMDNAVRLPIIGPVGVDAALGLFPVAGDALSAAIAVSLIARSLKYGVPRDVIARMLANVLVDVLVGAVPLVGDLADIWFRANARNVELLREYLAADARDVIDVTPVRTEINLRPHRADAAVGDGGRSQSLPTDPRPRE